MAMFDKSFIHAINEEEAAVFDVHFLTNITPLFFVEVLADLEKADLTDEKRTALVRNLAMKTPLFRSYPNVPHLPIVRNELLGCEVELRRVPLIGQGRRVQGKDGLGTVFDASPETQARDRWRDGKFEAAEYLAARAWRAMLAQAPESMGSFLQGNPARYSFTDLEAIKHFVDRIIDRDGSRYRTLKAALEVLGIEPTLRSRIIARWKGAGGPQFKDFAPYSRHVLGIDLFRVMAMASGHISPDKTSNYADMAYLYYLPFCEVFVSGDNLHRRCAPLFMGEGQEFVWGHELRPVLASLVELYLAHPDIAERGLIGVADDVPPADSFIGALYDRLRPGLREAMALPRPKLSPEQEKALVERLSAMTDAPPPNPDANLSDEDNAVSFKRTVPVRRGRFPFLPRHVVRNERSTD
jgi:hypothetical protein